jgi:hypothetical protein
VIRSLVRVPVTESERGWGRKIDDYMVCLSMADAYAFTEEFNSKNKPGAAPDWYMQVEHSPEAFEATDEMIEVVTEHKRIWLSTLSTIMINKENREK